MGRQFKKPGIQNNEARTMLFGEVMPYECGIQRTGDRFLGMTTSSVNRIAKREEMAELDVCAQN